MKNDKTYYVNTSSMHFALWNKSMELFEPPTQK